MKKQSRTRGPAMGQDGSLPYFTYRGDLMFCHQLAPQRPIERKLVVESLHESNPDKKEAGYIQLWWRAFRCKSATASAATSLATVKGVWLSPASGRCQLLLLLQFQKTEKRKLSMWEAQGYTNPIFITFILNGMYLETWIKSLYYPGPFFLLPRNGSPKKRDGY